MCMGIKCYSFSIWVGCVDVCAAIEAAVTIATSDMDTIITNNERLSLMQGCAHLRRRSRSSMMSSMRVICEKTRTLCPS